VAGNLRMNKINAPPGGSALVDRYVVCHNPDEAQRDASVREQLVG
jgi:hypothetical protein